MILHKVNVAIENRNELCWCNSEGAYHRVDGPAITLENIIKSYCLDGAFVGYIEFLMDDRTIVKSNK